MPKLNRLNPTGLHLIKESLPDQNFHDHVNKSMKNNTPETRKYSNEQRDDK